MAESWLILLFVGLIVALILTIVIPAEEDELIAAFGK
jgi:protein-S-isoprenylcysteine O-methyltransferase Ste14